MLTSVGSRLGTAFTVLSLCTVVCGSTGLWALDDLGARSAEQARIDHLLRQSQQIKYHNTDASGWQAYVFAQAVIEGVPSLNSDTYNIDGLEQSNRDGTALLTSFDRTAMSPDEQQDLTTVEAQWSQYFQQTEQLTVTSPVVV